MNIFFNPWATQLYSMLFALFGGYDYISYISYKAICGTWLY